MKKSLMLFSLLLVCSACSNFEKKDENIPLSRKNYNNILNIHGNPEKYTYFKPKKETDKTGTTILIVLVI